MTRCLIAALAAVATYQLCEPIFGGVVALFAGAAIFTTAIVMR